MHNTAKWSTQIAPICGEAVQRGMVFYTTCATARVWYHT